MAGTLLLPASGGARYSLRSAKSIRLAYHGCTNREFFHIVVMEKKKPRSGFVIEQLGTFDPMTSERGEKLCSINLERVSHWIGEGAEVSEPCAKLFGLAGLLPIHPKTYIAAWENRKTMAKSEEPAAT